MRVELPYGYGTLEGVVPEGMFQTVAPPTEPRKRTDLPSVFFHSLDNPYEYMSLQKFLTEKKRCLIVVSDATRKTGAGDLLPLLKAYLDFHGIDGFDIKIAIALGIHRRSTEQEITCLTGAGAFPLAEIVIPNPQDPSEFADFGQTSRNNSVKLHRAVA